MAGEVPYIKSSPVGAKAPASTKRHQTQYNKEVAVAPVHPGGHVCGRQKRLYQTTGYLTQRSRWMLRMPFVDNDTRVREGDNVVVVIHRSVHLKSTCYFYSLFSFLLPVPDKQSRNHFWWWQTLNTSFLLQTFGAANYGCTTLRAQPRIPGGFS